MKNLFIDSNIWLSLYSFTSDDLTQFTKLKDLIGKDLRLFIPEQVYNEIIRNREAKIKETFKAFDIKTVQFPAFVKGYEEYETFQSAYTEILHRYKNWVARINTDIKERNLPADKTIDELFAAVELIPCSEYVDEAVKRYRVGNPPGKENKYGDAINWECLLQNVPDGEDLYFISADKDYRSELFDEAFNPFLEEEWKIKKGANLFFYKNLVPFLNEHFKGIQLKSEEEKQKLIQRLKSSGSFLSTHGIIALLNKHSGWTDAQIEDLCAAAIENTQVSRIFTDDDVISFYIKILSNVKANELNNSATKQVFDELQIERGCIKREMDETVKFDMADAMEEYYNH